MTIRIFIDQGHNPGTVNAGASANGLEEQAVNFEVGNMLADLLDQDCRFAVRTSRMYPQQVLGSSTASSLQTRVDMANAWGADYFISIHCNYNVSPAVNGSEVYVYQEPSIAWTLAQSVLENMVRTADTRDNLVRVNASLYVLRRTSMPAIVVELAYLSNPSDAQKLRDDPFSFAYGIYLGILQFIFEQGGFPA